MSAKNSFRIPLLVAAVAGVLLLGACGGKKAKQADLRASAEPDKVLFERALEDIRKGRHTIGRLTLQTLINTYPDSEYLAKAKLAIADSFFKEGGTSGLTQAVVEYKDFMTFFPYLEEAPYAQMQVGMSHYRRMEKPDRDRSSARAAEDEFQAFLLKYPEHPRAGEAEQRLREVQEVMAEGDYRIARFYYVKGSLRAATSRLAELVERYPLYSQADRSLWMLGDVYERSEKTEYAAQYYSRIVRDYPLSEFAVRAKEKLTKLAVPVPQPNPEALARMQREQELSRQNPGFLRRSLGILRSGPDVSSASRTGKPNLAPPAEAVGATETITPGGNLSVSASAAGSSALPVETVATGAPPAAAAKTPAAGSNAAASAQGPEVPLSEKEKKKKEEEEKRREKPNPPARRKRVCVG